MPKKVTETYLSGVMFMSFRDLLLWPTVAMQRDPAYRERWAGRFDGMTLTPHDDGSTLIQGHVVDQAALHGLLAQIRDLGMPLLSVTHTGSAPPPDPSKSS